MEAKLRQIVMGLPGPEAVPQLEVKTLDGRYFIDFAYPNIKLGIEAHSIKWHMGEARFRYDLKRDRALKRGGWTLIYYAWDDLLHPMRVRKEITELRDALDRRLF
jgi:very-short-patch-repair endonuclease